MQIWWLSDPFRRLFPLSGLAFCIGFGVQAGILTPHPWAQSLLSWGILLCVVFWIRHDSLTTKYWPFYHYGM